MPSAPPRNPIRNKANKRPPFVKRILLAGMVAASAGLLLVAHGQLGRGAASDAPPLVQDASAFQTGDMLFVQGTSWRSRVVLLLGGDSNFSHVGLIRRRNGTPFVIHAAPTATSTHENGAVTAEPLRDFLSTARVSQAALYRVRGRRATAQRAASAAQTYAARALPFDHDFDATTPGTLYCTELIWRAYRAAGLRLPETFSATTGDPLLPTALRRSRRLSEVARFR